MEQTLHYTLTEQRSSYIGRMVKEYGQRLYRFIRGKVHTDEDASDILQDVWYQFSRVLNTEPIEEAGAWLYRVARNRISDKYRKKETDSLDSITEPGEEDVSFFSKLLPAESSTPESEYLRNLFWETLFESLEELPEEQKQVFIWHELEDVSFHEISERTGEKVNTLISRKRYAVLHLRSRLEELYKEITQH